MDCTGSMGSWIKTTKTNIVKIANDLKSSFNKDIFVGFLGYRDFDDSERFSLFDFSSDANKMENHLANVNACGGGDSAEDVIGAF